jgi:hypothetical protein
VDSVMLSMAPSPAPPSQAMFKMLLRMIPLPHEAPLPWG